MQPPALLGRADPARRTAHLRRPLPVPPRAAWEGLTAPEHTRVWLGRLVGAPLSEGRCFQIWHGQRVASRHVVQQWQPPRLLAITWDFPDEQPSRVTFELTRRSASRTDLTVHHGELGDPVSYAAGWHRHMEYLAAHLAGRDRSFEHFWEGYDDLVERYRRGAP